MKAISKILLVGLLICVTFTHRCFAQDVTNEELLLQLSEMNLDQYIGKQVQDLLDKEPISSNTKLTLFDYRSGIVNGVYIRLNDDVYLAVYVSVFTHIKNTFDADKIWDIELFKQEVISGIKVHNGSHLHSEFFQTETTTD